MEPPGLERLALALDLDRSEWLAGRRIGKHRPGRGAHYDLARPRDGHQPCAGVDRVADGGKASPGIRAKDADDRGTRVDPDPEDGPVGVGVAQGAGDPEDLACHRYRTDGVVRLVAGDVEQGQQAVAFEMLDRPAGTIDDRHDLGPVRVEHLDDLAGLVALAVWREAGQVDEHDADDPFLADR